ncbi:DUF4233 domain-containing protein [Subtercola sp. PAMC28395]|uniref:DUF4233 domain-containing protein n=1 Tax=Subtercola sp. PAMC28395 TaxID=2846775 RepID=UPI001C0B8AF9|nr:DUF4233 domain-containing protein [Subtercola sp. PAMC28395]QWT22940.1 DUF4233 domain-containing protein [Subtercola sp. PAMC28395]
MSDEGSPSESHGPVEPGVDSAARAGRGRGPRRQRSVRESLASIVLGFESVIMFLATLAVFGLKALPPFAALGGGAALCILLLATIPLLSRPIGIVMGWTLQALILASALLVPLMLIVAVLFGTMWIYCMIKGARIDRENAELESRA